MSNKFYDSNDMMNNIGNNQFNYNQQPLPFITGKIGFWDIAKEDMNTFNNNVRLTEWTNNQIYQNAKDVDITTRLSLNNKNTPAFNNKQRQSKYDSLYLNFSPHLNEFENYKREYNEKAQRIKDEINSQKNNFISRIFQGNVMQYELNMETILGKIKNEKYNLMVNDPKLSRILKDILPFYSSKNPIQQQQRVINNNQQQQMNYIQTNNNDNNNQQRGYNTQGMYNNNHLNIQQYNNSARYGNQISIDNQYYHNQAFKNGNPNQYQGMNNNPNLNNQKY